MGIKKDLDKIFGVTEEEIDQIILGQEIEDEEKKIKILKELVGYKSFEDYVNDHEEEFDDVEITDDFKMIIFSGEKYPDISLDKIKKIRIIADHFGIYRYVEPLEDKDKDKEKDKEKEIIKEKDNEKDSKYNRRDRNGNKSI